MASWRYTPATGARVIRPTDASVRVNVHLAVGRASGIRRRVGLGKDQLPRRVDRHQPALLSLLKSSMVLMVYLMARVR